MFKSRNRSVGVDGVWGGGCNVVDTKGIRFKNVLGLRGSELTPDVTGLREEVREGPVLPVVKYMYLI